MASVSVVGTGSVVASAVGNQKQDGDWMNVIKGGLRGSLTTISGEEDRSCHNCTVCGSMDFADFEEYRGNGGLTKCLESLHNLNPEFDIYKKGKLQMDFFDGFGLPGHIPVHAGLVITYPINDGKYVALHVDLAAGEGDVDIGGKEQNNKIVQKVQLTNGAQNTWTYRLV